MRLLVSHLLGAALALQSAPGTTAHKCHVYIVDVAAVKKAYARNDLDGFEKAAQKAEKMFSEFSPKIGEEELTTRHYNFPKSKLKITASVYYTDESMASSQGQNSMVIGVALAGKKLESALTDVRLSAIAEITLDHYTDTVRAKQYVRVNGRLYLLGIECRCKPRTRSD